MAARDLETMMRTIYSTTSLPALPARPAPPPSPIMLAVVAMAFAACELARATGAAHAAPIAVGCPAAGQQGQPTLPADSRTDGRSAALGDPESGGLDVLDSESLDPDLAPGAAALDDSALALHPTRGPAIAEVLSAAYAAAGLDLNPSRSWIRRARWAGLIPLLTIRTGRDTSWQNDEPTVDHGMALDIRATWRLDRLAFDGRELQVASIEAVRRRERQRLASRVIRTYFVWWRAAARAVHDHAVRSSAREAAAELDALTDGWFSKALGGSRH